MVIWPLTPFQSACQEELSQTQRELAQSQREFARSQREFARSQDEITRQRQELEHKDWQLSEKQQALDREKETSDNYKRIISMADSEKLARMQELQHMQIALQVCAKIMHVLYTVYSELDKFQWSS